MDFYFSQKRNNNAAYQFMKRVLRYYKEEKQPKTLKTDKYASYAYAISLLKKEGKLRGDVEQRKVKYRNNGVKSDHEPIKKLITSARRFRVRKLVFWLMALRSGRFPWIANKPFKSPKEPVVCWFFFYDVVLVAYW